jgi:hypothetical protein
MYAPVIRRFDWWSPCGKLFNEVWRELAYSRFFGLLCRPRMTWRRLWDRIITGAMRSVVKVVCWEVCWLVGRIRSCQWSTLCWCKRYVVSGAICMVVEDTGPARLEMVWDGKHGHFAGVKDTGPTRLEMVWDGKTRWEETLSHSVIVVAFSCSCRDIETASVKRSAAGKCMSTCDASYRRWTKTEIRNGWRRKVVISMWQRTEPKVLWWYVAGKNDICNTKHHTRDVCMVMGRKRTQLHQIIEQDRAHNQRKCKSSTSSILQVDRFTVCRPSVSSFIGTCLKTSKWSSTSHDLLKGVD